MTHVDLWTLMAQAGPVIPDFPKADKCIQDPDALFCWSWVQDNWSSILQPKLLEHIELTVIAVAAGTLLAVAAALFTYERRWFERPFVLFSTVVYTIPAIAMLQLLVPLTGLGKLTILVALTGYTLVVIFRNTLTGLRDVPSALTEAARSAGMTHRQILLRVNLPLAVPAILAGVRVATVVTISSATLAAFISPVGLGAPIFSGIDNSFNTALIAAGSLAIFLALAADGALVLLQRVATPWLRARR